jgi:peptidyl-prolyl cis-trans isomerase D
MLKVLRENLKYLSWILWVVILVFILFVFVDFGGTVGQQATVRESAAKVGEDDVTWGEFQRAYRRLEDQMRQMYGDNFSADVARQMRLPMQAMNQLVSQKILLAEARAMDLAATDDEVRRAVLDIPAFKDASGAFVGSDLYADILRSNGYTVAEFEQTIRDELVLDKLRSVLARSVFVPDAEVEKSYREQVERAAIRYVQLRTDRLPPSPPRPITDADLRAYYDAHKSELELGERRVVAYALVDQSVVRQNENVTDADLSAFYEANQEQYRREEEVRARHILVKVEGRTGSQAEAEIEAARRRIEAGEDFAAVAAAVSEDDSNKARGGDLGFFARGRMVKPFEDAAFGAATGELVGPVQTDFGFHLLQVLERREAGIRPFAEVREEIRARLLNERVNTTAEAKAKALAERVTKEKASTVEALQALIAGDPALSVEVTPAFSRTDSVPNIGRAGGFINAAFELAVGGVSAPVRVPRGFAVLLLTKIEPPRLPELAEVSDQVRQRIEAERKMDEVKQRLTQAKAEIAAGKTLVEVAAELGLEIVDAEPFGANAVIRGLGIQPELARAALALEQGQVGGPFQVNPLGAVLFEVTERTHFDAAMFAREKQSSRDNLTNERVQGLLSAIIEQRQRQLNVTFDPRLVEQFELVEPSVG